MLLYRAQSSRSTKARGRATLMDPAGGARSVSRARDTAYLCPYAMLCSYPGADVSPRCRSANARFLFLCDPRSVRNAIRDLCASSTRDHYTPPGEKRPLATELEWRPVATAPKSDPLWLWLVSRETCMGDKLKCRPLRSNTNTDAPLRVAISRSTRLSSRRSVVSRRICACEPEDH